MMREKILRILQKNSRLSNADIAAMIGIDEKEVEEEIKSLEESKIINGYQAVVNWENFDEDKVTAIIGVKISPVRGQGFDRIAERISRFEEVDSVVLISGSSSDLLLTIEGNSMKEISQFVYDKIAPMDSVVSTASYFVMKKYKDHKILFTEEQGSDERIQVMP
jgi:Transcriptional regulators